MLEVNINKDFTEKENKKIHLETGKVLTRDEQLRVIQWLVELKSTRDIAALVKEEFNKDITHCAIWQYSQSKKWKPLIKKLRTRFERNICRIPIANKADRLRYLQKVVDEGLKWSLKNITKDGDEIYERKIGDVVNAIKVAKEEIEGNKPLVDLSKHYHFSSIKEAVEYASIGDIKARNRALENIEGSRELAK